MDRQEIINKTMVKLGMLGEPKDPIDKVIKERILRRLWNERNPRNVIKLIQDAFVKFNSSKEAKQDLFKFFKQKGLIKRTLKHKNMERAWRLLLNENGLKGFLLEV